MELARAYAQQGSEVTKSAKRHNVGRMDAQGIHTDELTIKRRTIRFQAYAMRPWSVTCIASKSVTTLPPSSRESDETKRALGYRSTRRMGCK